MANAADLGGPSRAFGFFFNSMRALTGARRARHDQLRDHTGKKAKYWLILKEIIRAAPCFFLRVLAWY